MPSSPHPHTPPGLDSGRCAALLNRAAAAQQSGALDEAEAACRAVLDLDPGNPQALELMGLVAHARGDFATAITLLERAANGLPAAAVQVNLGNACLAAGRIEAALASYERAMALAPEDALPYRNCAIALHRSRGPAPAVGYYRLAAALDPTHAATQFNLGNALTELGNLAGAVEAYRNALRLDPRYCDAWFNLGNALREQGDLNGAVTAYRMLLELRPDHAEACNHLGHALARRQELDEAVLWYRKALALAPSFAGTHNNLGNAYKMQNRLDEALTQYREALALKPDFAEAHHNFAAVLSERGRFREAIAHYEEAARLDPGYASAVANSLVLRLQICDWSAYDENLKRLGALIRERLLLRETSPVDPFTVLSLPFEPQLQREVARAQAAAAERQVERLGRPARRAMTGDGRLRIGYVSPNFRNHPTAHLMVRLFGLHDRRRFEIYTYSWGPDDGSDYRRRIAADSDHFIDLSRTSIAEAAQRIADDGIHILVDRAGFTRHCRPELFALRPAPVQVNYIGFPGSLGARFIDYIITDPIVTPPQQLDQLDERPVYLPNCYLVTDPQPPIAARPPSRAECQLPEQGFVFCCFNTNYKIEPLVFGRWMRILQRTPGSALWLLRSSDAVHDNLKREAASRGVDPQRLVFADKIPKDRHLARHGLADLFLDTLHYNAHTTAVDALWCGVPLLTCPGISFQSRVAASVLCAAGLPELITADLDQYEEMAVALAAPGRIQAFKRRLQETRDKAALFDIETYARHLEQAYERMWALHSAGKAPEAIIVGNTRSD